MISITVLKFIFLCSILLKTLTTAGEIKVTILHVNDVHSRFSQTNKHSGTCSQKEELENKCYGGFARVYHQVREIRSKEPNVIFLSGGDYFQGTVWYTLYKWKVVSLFVNMLNHTAMALGNHEFDDNLEGLFPFVDSATFPIISSTIDPSDEPGFMERQKSGKLAKSTVTTLTDGTRVGIIGYTTTETMDVSNPGKLKFRDEVQSVAEEAKKLDAHGIKHLIAVGHAGYDVDQKIAAEVPLIDVVVGGHTNTFLYTGIPPDVEKPLGLYPTIVTQPSGKKVPVVQAYAYTKYLGHLHVTFNEKGDVLQSEGNPILLDSSVPQDETVLKLLNEWGQKVSENIKGEVGATKVFLNGKADECRLRECNLGNFVADGMVFSYLKSTAKAWTDVTMAITNSGGLRGSIDETAKNGSISFEDVLQVAPFRNTIDVVELKGSDLREAFEFCVKGYDPKGHHLAGKFLQVSGIQVVYDISKPEGERVRSLQVLCKECREPKYVPLEDKVVYKVAVPTYIRTGGDGFAIVRDKALAVHNTGILDTDSIVNYMKHRNPIIHGVEGRIRFYQETNPHCKQNGPVTANCIYSRRR